MSLFRRKSAGEGTSEAAADAASDSLVQSDSQAPPDEPGELADETTVAGERGITSVNRARSMQSRVSNLLAVGLMSVLGLGLLTWYYAKTASRQARAEQSAQAASRAKAQGEMPLPSLGPITPPAWSHAPPRESEAGEGAADQSALDHVLGPPPELPQQPMPPAWNAAAAYPPAYGTPTGYAEKTPGQLAVERRLSGPVFVGRGDLSGTAAGPPAPASLYIESAAESGGPPGAAGAWPPGVNAPGSGSAGDGGQGDGRLSTYLRPSVTAAVQARVLPTERMLLPKGAFVDCTLETAIDSTLPGMTTCVTASDTFSVDGKVVLLERGTKLVGETQGQVRQGAARVFVLWTEARTPTGVVVPLASPGTDALGRSGLPGEVNRHFWERFGAAILISVIDGAVQAAVQSESGGGTVIYNPSSTENIMTEVLKSTVNIPPTVVVPNGDRIQVFVARDLDFRSVYELRPVAAERELSGNPSSGHDPSALGVSGHELPGHE